MRQDRKNSIVRLTATALIAASMIGLGIGVSKGLIGTKVYSMEVNDGTVHAREAAAQATVTPQATATPAPKPSVSYYINYKTQILKVMTGPAGSTKIYISQDKLKTWQLIGVTSNGVLDLDLSIFMKTSDHTIYLKGNKDAGVVEVTIPKEDKSLKVTYAVEGKGVLKFTNASGDLEYRKGPNESWIDYKTALDLSAYEINGYTLQFRTKATESKRAGKVVNVKIPKRPNAPSVKVDYSDFVITGLKKDSTMYMIDGKTDWLPFAPKDTKEKGLDLAALLLPANTAENTVPIPAATILIKSKATDKKMESAVRVLEIAAQPAAPAGPMILDKITITFPTASKTNVFEYVVLHAGEKMDVSEAKWKKVTSEKPIKITKVGTAWPVPGDVIYYRSACMTDTKTKEVTPASLYMKTAIIAVVKPE